jgi:hypothetical protein
MSNKMKVKDASEEIADEAPAILDEAVEAHKDSDEIVVLDIDDTYPENAPKNLAGPNSCVECIQEREEAGRDRIACETCTDPGRIWSNSWSRNGR